MSLLSDALRRTFKTKTATIALVIAAVFALGAAAVLYEAQTWHDGLVSEQRLLPGEVIGGVDVGEATLAEARDRVGTAERALLDAPVAATFDGQRWERSTAELGGRTNAEDALDRAVARALDPSLTDLLRVRWVGEPRSAALVVEAGPEEVDAFVESLAAEINRDPAPATLVWVEDHLELHEHVEGLALDREGARDALLAAVTGEPGEVALPVGRAEPGVLTAQVEAVQPAVADAVTAALDHEVTVTYDARSWSTSPRQLAATPDAQAVVDAALAGGPVDGDTVAEAASVVTDAVGEGLARAPLSLADDAVVAFVDAIAADVDVAAVDASLDTSSGWVQITSSRTGLAVDRSATATAVSEALAGAGDTVELVVDTTQPAVSAAAYDQVLLVRHGDRRLYLYEGGEIVRDWPVAIGAEGHDTPTGLFTVGAMRHLPTWHNPSPDGWGADMPEVIEPGPDNPLGLRAINWNRGGADTLIRFHGTPNADSIGEAASKGCVRMFNSDVVELYDLVRTGSTIVSLR